MASAFTLTIVNGPEPEKKFAFLQKTVNLGRSAADNDVIINENSISGRHARIICEKNQLFLQDLGSTNKTRYNDTVLGKGDKQLLQSGTEFRLGNIVLRFEVQTAPAGAQAGTAGTRAMGVRGLADKIKLGDQGPLKSRPVMVAGAGLFMLIVVLLFVKALMEPGEEPLPEIDDLSNQPIDLPLEGVIGYTKTADQSHPDKAVFTFSAKSGRTTLYYTAGAVDADDEVAIFLNGNQIGAVPVAAQGWGDEQQLELPKNLVLKGGINRVTFDNTRSPPALEMWAIKEVRVETQEAVACDEQAAKKLFALADVRLTEKDADQGNLYRAFRSYADGIALLESCSPTPALLAEMEKKQRRTKEELDKRYDSLVFSVKRAVNLEQYDQAGVILEAIMRLIPDPRDGRHQEAQAYYKKITEAALGWQEE